MTREEAIKYAEAMKAKIQEKLGRFENTHGPEVYYSDLAFLSAAISSLREQEERRWIPVEERLPEDDRDVLIVGSGNPVKNVRLENSLEIAIFSKDDGWILECWPNWETPIVTHWMPLPEPPKEA